MFRLFMASLVAILFAADADATQRGQARRANRAQIRQDASCSTISTVAVSQATTTTVRAVAVTQAIPVTVVTAPQSVTVGAGRGASGSCGAPAGRSGLFRRR